METFYDQAQRREDRRRKRGKEGGRERGNMGREKGMEERRRKGGRMERGGRRKGAERKRGKEGRVRPCPGLCPCVTDLKPSEQLSSSEIQLLCCARNSVELTQRVCSLCLLGVCTSFHIRTWDVSKLSPLSLKEQG